LLRGSKYNVHDKQGYKFFSFSNIFPYHDLIKGDRRNLFIASPNDDFISYIKEQLEYLKNITVGAMNFKIEGCKKLTNNMSSTPIGLITGTPILCNIRRYKFEEALNLANIDGHAATYWKSNHPINLFLNQVQANLIKKYNIYNDLPIDTNKPKNEIEEYEKSIFYLPRFRRQLAIPLAMGQGRYNPIMVGSYWSFGITDLELAKFALDVGLGELNSMGFGFMNIDRKRMWLN